MNNYNDGQQTLINKAMSHEMNMLGNIEYHHTGA